MIYHIIGCTVVLIVLAFAPHFEFDNFLNRLLGVATFNFVLKNICVWLEIVIRSRLKSTRITYFERVVLQDLDMHASSMSSSIAYIRIWYNSSL